MLLVYIPNISYLKCYKKIFICDRKIISSKENSQKKQQIEQILLDTANNPTLHALASYHPPEILMAEEEKKHFQQESVATFVMKGQYKTI